MSQSFLFFSFMVLTSFCACFEANTTQVVLGSLNLTGFNQSQLLLLGGNASNRFHDPNGWPDDFPPHHDFHDNHSGLIWGIPLALFVIVVCLALCTCLCPLILIFGGVIAVGCACCKLGGSNQPVVMGTAGAGYPGQVLQQPPPPNNPAAPAPAAQAAAVPEEGQAQQPRP